MFKYCYHYIMMKWWGFWLKRELNKLRQFLRSHGDTTEYTDEGLLDSIKLWVKDPLEYERRYKISKHFAENPQKVEDWNVCQTCGSSFKNLHLDSDRGYRQIGKCPDEFHT